MLVKVARRLYKILGPERSTKLAHSRIGRVAYALLNRRTGDYIYTVDQGIGLQLTKEEAMYMGGKAALGTWQVVRVGSARVNRGDPSFRADSPSAVYFGLPEFIFGSSGVAYGSHGPSAQGRFFVAAPGNLQSPLE